MRCLPGLGPESAKNAPAGCPLRWPLAPGIATRRAPGQACRGEWGAWPPVHLGVCTQDLTSVVCPGAQVTCRMDVGCIPKSLSGVPWPECSRELHHVRYHTRCRQVGPLEPCRTGGQCGPHTHKVKTRKAAPLDCWCSPANHGPSCHPDFPPSATGFKHPQATTSGVHLVVRDLTSFKGIRIRLHLSGRRYRFCSAPRCPSSCQQGRSTMVLLKMLLPPEMAAVWALLNL